MTNAPTWINPADELPKSMQPILILVREFGFDPTVYVGYAFLSKNQVPVWFMKYSFYFLDDQHPDLIISGTVIGWYPLPTLINNEEEN